MARNNAGTWSKPIASFIAFTKIESAKMNVLIDDIGAEITDSLARNTGTGAMGRNLPMGNNRVTGMAGATALTDAATANQVQNGSLGFAVDSGAANAYVVTLAPVPTSYTTGMTVWFTTSNANTGASTINVNSLGAKNIKRDASTNLSAGDIDSSKPVGLVYDGTQFILFAGPSISASGSGILCTATAGTESAPAICLDNANTGGSTTGFFGISSASLFSSHVAVTVASVEAARFADGTPDKGLIMNGNDGFNSIVSNTNDSHLWIGAGTQENEGGGFIIRGTGTGVDGDLLYYVDNTLHFQYDASQSQLEMQDNAIVDSPTTCKAFAHCSISGGVLTVEESFNCTVTRQSAGEYTMTFTNALSSANYCFVGTVRGNSSKRWLNERPSGTRSTSAVQFWTGGDVTTDEDRFSVMVFGL